MASVWCKSNCDYKNKATGRCICKSVSVDRKGVCSMARFSMFKTGENEKTMSELKARIEELELNLGIC